MEPEDEEGEEGVVGTSCEKWFTVCWVKLPNGLKVVDWSAWYPGTMSSRQFQQYFFFLSKKQFTHRRCWQWIEIVKGKTHLWCHIWHWVSCLFVCRSSTKSDHAGHRKLSCFSVLSLDFSLDFSLGHLEWSKKIQYTWKKTNRRTNKNKKKTERDWKIKKNSKKHTNKNKTYTHFYQDQINNHCR